jgi:VWFA-related protein
MTPVILLLLFFSMAAFVSVPGQSRPQKPNTSPGNEKKNQRPTAEEIKREEEKRKQEEEEKNAIKDEEVLTINSNVVNVDTVVYDKKTGQIITGLKKENFAIFEDGKKQEITNFATPEAPITVTMVIDFSRTASALGAADSRGYDPGKMEVVRPAAYFLSRFIKPPGDFASLIAFDIRPTPITDFTNDPNRLRQTVDLLLNNNPAFTDSNLFDALKLALVGGKADSVVLENSKQEKMDYGGMISVKAKRRAIILVATGIDSRSRINYDQAQKLVQSSGIPVYVIGTGEMFLKLYDNQIDAMDTISGFPGRLTLLQAKNTLNTFAKQSGGMYYPMTFPSEIPGILNNINTLLRNQYSLAYDGGDKPKDGRKYKLEVKIDLDGDGVYDDKRLVVQHRPFLVAEGDKKK